MLMLQLPGKLQVAMMDLQCDVMTSEINLNMSGCLAFLNH
jgi:hypothetical protein